MLDVGTHVMNVLFPRGCAGCDKPDDVLCDTCRALFDCGISQPLESALMGRWFACGWYRGAARQAILAWKDHGDEECDHPFADALRSLAGRAGVVNCLSKDMVCDRVLIVPAPSSCASMRQRGRRHMMPLSQRLASYLHSQTGIRVQACAALESRGVTGKSVETKGTAQRSQRLKGHISVRSGISLQGAAVILVDDIITSGTTMRRCVEALVSQGALVVTVLALAYTPVGRPAKDDGHLSLEM